jgi:single-stranded-DNA-specific exonuclease
MSKVWKTREVDETLAAQLGRKLDLPGPLARAVAARGYADPGSAERFLAPRLSDVGNPFDLPGAAAAVGRIWSAIGRNEPIVVYGDYDADGITATALMVRVLSALNARVAPFLPSRMDDGYGLGEEPLRRCMARHAPRLLITVDCGTNSAAVVRDAQASGLDVIVTDHHEPAETVAPALALVNPRLGSGESAKLLAGVGVAFKLCHALLKAGRDAGHAAAGSVELRRHLDLVAVGTIADMVPLQGENRIFARHGLAQLNQTGCVGLRALMDVARIGTADAYHVAFLIGPRLNAAGRLGDAEASLSLLLTDDDGLAGRLAAQLDRANRERQDVEAMILEEAEAQLQASFDAARDFGLVLAGRDWHPGVVGIVASRIANRYRRPAVVIGLDESGGGRGSCRSIEGFHLVRHLEQCAAHLVKFGGHAMAAGLEIEASAVEAFRRAFNSAAASTLAGQDLRPVQAIDAWLSLGDAEERLMEGLDRMKPFGLGNPTPVWAVRGVHVLGEPRVVGGKHLKLRVAAGATVRDCIAFQMADRKLPPGDLDIAFTLQRDTYQGRRSIQLNLSDFRPSPAAPG